MFVVFRRKLSQIFDACLEARSCREGCPHTYKQVQGAVIVICQRKPRHNYSNYRKVVPADSTSWKHYCLEGYNRPMGFFPHPFYICKIFPLILNLPRYGYIHKELICPVLNWPIKKRGKWGENKTESNIYLYTVSIIIYMSV